MEFSKRNIIIIAGIVVLLLAVILGLLSLTNQPEDNQQAANNQPEVIDSQSVQTNPPVTNGEQAERPNSGIRAVAKNFIERYLSFSNQNLGENIELLQNSMTSSMYNQAQQQLSSWEAQHPQDDYYGVSARVLSMSVVANGTQDSRLLSDVQLQINNQDEELIEYAQYEIYLIKSGESWLVSDFKKVE